MTTFQWMIAPPLLGMAVVHASRLLRREVRRSRGLFWMIIWGSAGLLVVRPDLSSRVARLVGIGRGTDLVLYVALIAGLFAAFYQYRQFRKLEITLTELVRHIAIQNSEEGGGPRADQSASC